MEPGELIAGRYRLVAPVGRGAMGIVWRAVDQELDRPVAVKQLVVDESDEARAEEATARALREGRIARRLRHPNAIAVYDVAEHHGRPCLVMEYLPAATMAGGDVLEPRQAASVGAQLAAALGAAHDAGIVHRDIKPDNVLITADGTAKITDFGISRASGDHSVTATGILAGTPAYLAPEVARGGEADYRSDVFSLGATLYALLEGVPPFGVDDNPIKLLHRVADGVIDPPRHAGELTDVLRWLLRPNPADRPTMHTARAALAAVAEGRRGDAPPPRQPTLALPPRRRVSRRVVAAGLGAVVLVAAGLVAGLLVDDDERAGAATPSSATPSSATASTSQPAAEAPACAALFQVGNTWPGGYQARVTLRNDGTTDLTGWQLTWAMPAGHQISGMWGGRYTQDGTAVTVTHEPYTVTVSAGGTVDIGMTVSAGDDQRATPEIRCQER